MKSPFRRSDGTAGDSLPTHNQRQGPPKQDNNGDYVSKDFRAHAVAVSGEFVGTISFLWFAFSGTQIANTITPTGTFNVGQLFYISTSFGFSLAVNAWVFYRISGGLFNPAVTFGMVLAGALPWLRGVLLFPAQLLGGLVAAGLVSAMFPGTMPVTTTLGANTSIARGLFIEMFCTFLLVFTILMLAAEKQKSTFIAPIGIGLSLFVAELSAVYYTGGSLNPTRSFGPAAANHSFPGYHWIYWLGPLMGGALAAGYYRVQKALNYEDANPGQDATSEQESKNA